jgi:hypothetical protein
MREQYKSVYCSRILIMVYAYYSIQVTSDLLAKSYLTTNQSDAVTTGSLNLR